MARNDPSPKQIADLERQQREAELEAEFAEFERKEKERAAKEAAYDREREKVERSYEKQNTTKTYTGIKTVDKYLDKSDISAETQASARRIAEEKKIRKLERKGSISPEYADYLRKESAGKYEKQKVSTVRMAVETGSKLVSGFASGASSYLDNGGSVGTPRLRRNYKRNIRMDRGSFSTGIRMDVGSPSISSRFPSFGAPSFGSPTVSVTPKKKIGELNMGFPKMTVTKFPTASAGRFSVGNPFGAKKENPLTDKRKRKGLW